MNALDVVGVTDPKAKPLHRLGGELTNLIATLEGVPGSNVSIPETVIGSIEVGTGHSNLTISGMRATSTILGRVVFPFPSLSAALRFDVSAVAGKVLSGAEEGVTLAVGQRCLLSYNLSAGQLGDQPRETNGDERRLIYGEIVEVASINAERTQVTLVDDLGRTYEPLGGKLRLYPFGDKLNENITIENLIIDGQDSLDFLIDNGIAMRYVDGVTIRNATFSAC